jgi:hypothetical protein
VAPEATASPDPPLADDPDFGADWLHDNANTASNETVRIMGLTARILSPKRPSADHRHGSELVCKSDSRCEVRYEKFYVVILLACRAPVNEIPRSRRGRG